MQSGVSRLKLAAAYTHLAGHMTARYLSIGYSAGAVYRPPEIHPAFWKGAALCTEPKPIPGMFIEHHHYKSL